MKTKPILPAFPASVALFEAAAAAWLSIHENKNHNK